MEPILPALGATAALAVQIAVGLILASAAIAKLRDRGTFAGVVADYRLAPDWAVAPIALLLPLAELAIGAMLILGLALPIAVIGGVALLALFAGAIAINLQRGRTTIDCGCSLTASGQSIHPLMVWRNLGLGLALMFSLPLTLPLAGGMIASGLAAGAVLFLLYLLFNHVIALTGRAAAFRRGH
jgi:hypothetical protein